MSDERHKLITDVQIDEEESVRGGLESVVFDMR